MSKTESKIQTLIKFVKKISKYSYINADITHLNCQKIKTDIDPKTKYNRDMLQIGSVFTGMYKKKPKDVFTCFIADNGKYIVNNQQYNSLSEAAKAVTGVRTEGLHFWKLYKKGPSVLDKFRSLK